MGLFGFKLPSFGALHWRGPQPPLKLRSHLLLLTVATLLPMIVLALLGALLFTQHERRIFQRGASERTRALLTALDAELNGYISTLAALATSRHLDVDDVSAFHAEAVRVLQSQPDWLTINLAAPSGQQLVNTIRPFGSKPLAIAERRSFERVLKNGGHSIGSLKINAVTNQLDFAIRVPVVRNGISKYVLSALVKPQAIYRLLAPQRLPPDWVGVVLDQNERIVARTVAPEKTVGQPASDSLRAALARAPEGWFRGSTVEGWGVYTPYIRSTFSGWTVAMGIPAAAVEAADRTTTWGIAGGILIATVLALMVATAVGRRIARPIITLASAAEAVGRGERPNIQQPIAVEEIAYVTSALEDAAAAVRAREETQGRLAAIVDSSRDAIISYSLDGRVLTWNRGAEELFGYNADESRDRHVSFLVPPERAHEPGEVFSAVGRGESRELETVRMKKDGAKIDVALSVSPIRNAAGEVIGVSASIRDITERKQAEEALREAARRKDEFLAMLGHELRNPVGIISTAVQLLGRLRPLPEAKLQEVREMIERQVDHTSRLLDDLLDVSRISRGKIQLNKERWDVCEIVHQTVDDYRTALSANDLRLELSLPDQPLPIFGDRTRLAQALGNLLNNACKFTQPGDTVGVNLEKVDQRNALLTVSDTGLGMEPEMLRWVFEPFSQADHSIDRSRGGLGLGLALVKGIVEFHGGDVTAASDGPGRGSAFTVRLPLERGEGRYESSVRNDDNKVPTKRILVVEDNPVAAQNMRALLELSGHIVETAHTGPAGVQAARKFQPEIVLCDIGLPELDGYGVAKALRQQVGLSQAYLIAVSGYAQDERRAQEAGFNAHILKPLNFEKLEALLAKLIRERGDSLR